MIFTVVFPFCQCWLNFLPALGWSFGHLAIPCPVPSAVTMGKPLKRPAAKKPASKKRPAAAKRQRLAAYKKDPTNQSTLFKTDT